MITEKIISLALLAAGGISFIGYKNWQVKKERRKNAELTAENAKQQAEIEAKKQELEHAQIKQKHTKDVLHRSGNAVDEQLHAKGYFRDDD